jgi:hypothetical protein
VAAVATPAPSWPTPIRSNLPSAAQLTLVLHDAVNPFQREWAAESLAVVQWPSYNEVVRCLLTAIRTDTAAAVRVQCIRTLAHRNVNIPEVIHTIAEQKAHPDPRVRHEADMALSRFGQSAPRAALPPARAGESIFVGRGS